MFPKKAAVLKFKSFNSGHFMVYNIDGNVRIRISKEFIVFAFFNLRKK